MHTDQKLISHHTKAHHALVEGMYQGEKSQPLAFSKVPSAALDAIVVTALDETWPPTQSYNSLV